MEHHSEYEDRLWESQCRLPSTVRSRSAVSKLRAMPPDAQTFCIAKYALHNLPHLLRCALTAGVSPDTRWGEENLSLLCIAAERGSDRALEALLVGRANVALADSKGWTAAHLAAYFGHAPCLRLLLDAGAPRDAKDKEGDTPLHYAALEGHTECCSLLISSGCSLEARNNKQSVPLYFASTNGHFAVILLLLDAGAELEAKAGDGRTALGIAAEKGHTDIIKLLLARGANPNTADAFGNTPLMGAVGHKHVACVEDLLPVSILSATNQQGYNAFHITITTGSEECFQLLLPLVGDVDVRTVPGIDLDGVSSSTIFNETPLSLACSFGQHDMAKALLRRGASRTARDSMQRTPLHHAAQKGHASCVALLLGKPGRYKLTPEEVNAADNIGLTPLHAAAYHGHENICGSLIAAGARLDAVNSDGFTPLMCAEQEYPANTALLDLLAGRGPEHPPGTVCDGCGRPETEVQLHPCSGCWSARYCGSACNAAAWPAHKAECRRLQAEREERSTPTMFDPYAGSS